MVSNQLSVAVGLAMVLAGIGLWGISAYAQLQRLHATQVSPPATFYPACSPLPPPPTCPSQPTVSPAVLSVSPSVSISPSASTSSSSSASAPTIAPETRGVLFLFEPGKAVFRKGEIQRLLAFGREQLRTPQVRLQIEGIGEEEGPQGVALGRKRGIITRQLLSDAGFDSERLMLAPPRPFTSPEDAGVWLRPVEVKSP
ncbi:MAG: hypothetical protein RMJ98_15665 [Myxococcales bacterium]|nr:hypothetical protein [Polyangiaceae bacterium]MDW8250733.1 hypothetical protein [Myxococcales bacterium]